MVRAPCRAAEIVWRCDRNEEEGKAVEGLVGGGGVQGRGGGGSNRVAILFLFKGYFFYF